MVIRQITGTENVPTQYFGLPPLDPGGRLALHPTNPIADGSGANNTGTTLYYIPFFHNNVPFFSSSRNAWGVRTFTTLSLPLTGLAVGSYDIFMRWSGSAFSLVATPWTTPTTRAVADTPTADRYFVRGTTKTDLFLGSIYLQVIGTSQDSLVNRYCWNFYNRVDKQLLTLDTTSTPYAPTAGAWTLLNNSTTLNRVGLINGYPATTPVVRTTFTVNVQFSSQAGSDFAYFGLGLDTGLANPDPGQPSTFCSVGLSPTFGYPFVAEKFITIPIGFHWLQGAVQRSSTGVTFTFAGSGVGKVEVIWPC